MNQKLVKLAIVSVLLSMSNMANANPALDQERIYLYTPKSGASNEYTVGALLLRPGGSNDYAVLVSPFDQSLPAPILSPDWEPKGMEANFDAGFSLNFRHVFSQTGADINFSWTRIRAKDDNTFGVDRSPPPAQQFTGPFWNIGPSAGVVSTANGSLINNYDVITAEIGKQVNFDSCFKMRLFAGMSALWLHRRSTADFTGIDPVLGPFTFDITTISKYNAAGMRLGLSGEYNGWGNFSPVGLLAGNLYVGSQQPTTETQGTGSILSSAGIPQNEQHISHDSYVQVVPAIDAKLGLKYTRLYERDRSFAIEAGYMASIYVEAIQNYVPSTYVPASLGIVSGGVFLQGLLKATDSFSVDGPYLTVSVKM